MPQCEGGRSVDSGVELQEWLVRLCRCTALHLASQNGHTETAMALFKADTDVHCKDNDGYGPLNRMLVSLGCRQCGDGPVRRLGMELQEWLVRLCRRTALHWASQNGHTETAMALFKVDTDVQCTANDGYGSRGCMLVSLGCRQFGGGPVRRLGMELQEWLFWPCRRTALHSASLNGHTETAMALYKAGADVHCKDNDGYRPWGRMLVSLGCHSAGEDDPSTWVWSCRSGCFGYAGGRCCTMRRRTATRRRRWRWSGRARTCTAGRTTGTVLALHPGDIGLPQCGGGRSVDWG